MMDEAELDFSRAEVGDSPLDPPPPARRPPAPVPDRDTLVSPPEEAEEIRRQHPAGRCPRSAWTRSRRTTRRRSRRSRSTRRRPGAPREESFDMDLTPPPSSAPARPPPSGPRPVPAPSANVAPVSVDLRRGPTEVTIPLDVVLENGSRPRSAWTCGSPSTSRARSRAGRQSPAAGAAKHGRALDLVVAHLGRVEVLEVRPQLGEGLRRRTAASCARA